MAYQLLPADAALAQKVTLKMSVYTAGKGGQSGGFATAGQVMFQFPPTIKSDNKMINWMEKDIRNEEPLAIFMGSKPREIDLSWTYIVGVGGKAWSAAAIAKLVKSFRQFFYNKVGNGLIIHFRAYDVVGKSGGPTATFRAEGISVSHDGPIMNDSSTYYPLRTDLNMKLKFWTKGEPGSEQQKAESEEKLTLLDGLKDYSFLRNNPEWY